MATISTIFKSRTILLDVLAGRGFNVEEYNNYSIAHVGDMYEQNQLDLLLTDDRGKKVFVKYSLSGKPNFNDLVDKFYQSDILSKGDDLLIITKDELTDSTQEHLERIWSTYGYYIMTINIKRLQYNILKHQMNPTFTILTEEEKTAVLTKYSATLAQLPEISRYDPVSVLIGLRPGMVCHILRKSKISMESDYYRVCV